MTLGASSIGAPICDADGRVRAALGLVTSSHRRDLSRLAPAVQVAARSIGRAVQFPPVAERRVARVDGRG
jgi:DNA-binding IclR family transcriptional regulator